jgi:hypothetical protein
MRVTASRGQLTVGLRSLTGHLVVSLAQAAGVENLQGINLIDNVQERAVG